MKFRNGFVSNSSSSSFIVAFDEHPSNINYLKRVLFGNAETIQDQYNDHMWNVVELCEQIITQIEERGSPTNEIIYEELKHAGCELGVPYPDYPTLFNQSHTKQTEMFKKYDQKCKVAAHHWIDKFTSENKDSFIFIFEFGDDWSMGCQLEHGGTFENINHLRISKH